MTAKRTPVGKHDEQRPTTRKQQQQPQQLTGDRYVDGVPLAVAAGALVQAGVLARDTLDGQVPVGGGQHARVVLEVRRRLVCAKAARLQRGLVRSEKNAANSQVTKVN